MTEKVCPPDDNLNAILTQLVKGLRCVLGETLIGAHLGGSLAHGGWDA
ncbi:MAG: hypothetical protein SVR81_11205 [Chloroflexota bacterium]|nr:hypothetical protein [Chloroflexota bacterium]